MQGDARKEKSGITRGRKHPKWNSHQDSSTCPLGHAGLQSTGMLLCQPLSTQKASSEPLEEVSQGGHAGAVVMALSQQSSPCLCTCLAAEL